MKSLQELTNLYPLAKTLRFELKPVGKTLEQIRERGLIDQDAQRAEEYYIVKEAIDSYHKAFIRECMTQCKLKVESQENKKDSLKEYSELLSVRQRSIEQEKDIQIIRDNLREQIVKAFENNPQYKTLFKSELVSKHLSVHESDSDTLEIISHFSKYTTYFSGLHKNRKNMYDKEAKSTAIAYRLIHENFPVFYSNMHSFSSISNSEVVDSIHSVESSFASYLKDIRLADMFTLEYFNSVLTQEQIDLYNTIIGGKKEEDGTLTQGINGIVNNYNQQHKESRLPLLKPLRKIMLSDRVSLSWLSEEFNSDEEMLCAINSFYESIQDVLVGSGEKSILNLLRNIHLYDTEHIYIANDLGFTDISQHMFGRYDFFTQSVKCWIRENEVTPTRAEKQDPEKLAERIDKIYKTRKSFSISFLDNFMDSQYSIESYFAQLGASYEEGANNANLITKIQTAYFDAKDVLEGKYAEVNQNDHAVKCIKDLLDGFKQLQHFIKPLLGSGEEVERDAVFSAYLLEAWDALGLITPLYNRVRNWLTRKPYSTKKIKLCFENKGDLLGGWMDSKTEKSDNGTQYGGYIFRKANEIGEYDYYLGISADSKLFRYDDSVHYDGSMYERLDYCQLKSQTIFGSSYEGDYKKEIKELMDCFAEAIHNLGVDKKYLPKPEDSVSKYLKRIQNEESGIFCVLLHDKKVACVYNNIKNRLLHALAKAKWSKEAQALSKHNEYELDVLITKISNLNSRLYRYFPVDYSTIQEANERKKKPLYLFKISNKDLSFAETYSKGLRHSRGADNIHTMYFKALLSSQQDVFDIGSGEVFFRKATKGLNESTAVHKAHDVLANKNPNREKKTSIFDYDIIKNRRYVYDKFQLHLSINLNYSANTCSEKEFNLRVRDIIRNGGVEHVIGIDRGERNLLYLSLIDLNGNIVKQMTLNVIKQKEDDKSGTNYRDILADREGNRMEARKNWKQLENIKDLKAGYLSQAIHVITKMITQYNAIVVLEDLNMGFMRGRQKIERSVYEQFERMLIEKLNYLVDKQKDYDCPEGLLRGLQLSTKFEGVSKQGKQNGCVFYVPAWNTSNIDPVTGFINALDTRCDTKEQLYRFFNSFDSIRYNSEKDWFEFDFDYNSFNDKLRGTKTQWTLCTYGSRIRTFRNPDRLNYWDNEEVVLTEEFKKFFASVGIDIHGNLKESICSLDSSESLKQLMRLMRLLLQLRNSISNTDTDYILSPVAQNGVFFDSRAGIEGLPTDADANGAYNIARKGLCMIRQIQDDKNAKLALSNKEWLMFVQDKDNFR